MYIVTSIFVVFAVIQIVYLIIYLIAISQYRAEAPEEEVPVSVIVCGHDEQQNLQELLPLLLNQEYSNYEIVIVEDRSNDESFDFLYEACKHHHKLRMVRVTNKPEHVHGKKFALTLGIKAARHEWVLLTDADCRPSSTHWIKEMSTRFSDKHAIVLGYSPYQKRSGFLNLFIRYETLLTAIQYFGLAILGRPYMGVGRNLAYRKSLFLNNKGFNSHLSVTGGDDDLFVNQWGHRDNTAIVVGPESIVYSAPKSSWMEFYYQKLRHLSVGKRYKFSDKILSGIFMISLLGSWLLLVPAIVYSPILYVPIVVFTIRVFLLTLLAHKASRKLGEAFEGWKVPFLDFIFVIYYLVVGLAAIRTNQVRWKKI